MAIGTQSNITMHSGDTRNLLITVVDSTSTAVDLTAAGITWALSKKAADSIAPRGAALVTKAIGTGVSIIVAGDGTLSVVLDTADTSALSGVYYHEMQLTQGAAISTILYGTVTISKDLI